LRHYQPFYYIIVESFIVFWHIWRAISKNGGGFDGRGYFLETLVSYVFFVDMSLYVTHYTKSTRHEHRLLSLVQYISAFDFKCNIDLLSQVEINNIGGLPNWIPEKILNVRKILVVLSKEYIQVRSSCFSLGMKNSLE
jgi:hypothetical protein